MNSEVKGVLISIMALAVAGGMSAFNFNETAQVKDTQDQIVINQDAQKFTPADVWSTLKSDKKQLNDLIIPTSSYDDSVIRNIISNLQKDNEQLKADVNNTKSQILSINNELIVAKASLNKLSQATPQGKAMYSLKLLKSDGQIATDGEYLQSETVYVSGKYTGTSAKFDISFKRSGQQVQSNVGLGMPSDGIFSYVFNTGHNQALGSYTVTVIIDGKSDTISFEIV